MSTKNKFKSMLSILSKETKSIIIKKFLITTFHGFPHITRNKHFPLQVLWFFSISVCFIACGFYLNNNVTDYLKYDVTTQIKYIDEKKVIFPAVEICNTHLFYTNYSIDLLIDYLKNNSHYVYEDSTLDKREFLNKILFEDPNVENLLKTFANGLNENQQKLLGLSLDEILISCTFVSMQCTLSDFNWNYRKSFGNCFTFNIGKKYISYGSGETYKLKIEIFTGFENFFIKSNDQQHGIKILIYNQSDFHQIKDYGIDAGSGSALTIKASRKMSNSLKKPYSDCDFEKDFQPSANEFDLSIFNMFVKANKTYSFENCLRLCYRRIAMSKCNCYDNILKPYPEVTQLNYCKTEAESWCLDKLYNEIVIDRVEHYNCSKVCPFECSFSYLRLDSYYTRFPTTYYANYLLRNHKYFINYSKNHNLVADDIKQNLVQLNIYYQDLSYELIAQTASITWMSLIADTGGVLGLFIGISLLSFVEIIEMFIEIFIQAFNAAKIKIHPAE